MRRTIRGRDSQHAAAGHQRTLARRGSDGLPRVLRHDLRTALHRIGARELDREHRRHGRAHGHAYRCRHDLRRVHRQRPDRPARARASRASRRARAHHGPPARPAPLPRDGRTADGPRPRAAEDRGREPAERSPRRFPVLPRATERRVSPPRLDERHRSHPRGVDRRARASRRVGRVQRGGRRASRRNRRAPRSAQRRRARDGLRRLLQLQGVELRHDLGGDDGAPRPSRRRDATALRGAAVLGPLSPGGAVRRSRRPRAHPGALHRQSVGPVLAWARSGRPARCARGRPRADVDRRASRALLREHGLPRAAADVLGTLGSLSGRRRADAGEERPRERMAHRPRPRRPLAHERGADVGLVRDDPPRARAHLLLPRVLAARSSAALARGRQPRVP